MKHLATFALLAASPGLLLADFSYKQTTKITGGAMAGMMKFAGAFSKKANQPVESAVYVHGNRMARINSSSGEIVDLDKETITQLNYEKKTYSTMTFAELRQRMEEAMQKMKSKQAAQPQDGTEMKFKVSSKETGQKKTIAGYEAKEVVLTIEMDATDQTKGTQAAANIESHVWLAPDIEGYGEVREFERKMAKQIGMLPDQQMAQMRQSMQGMVEVNRQMAEMKGIPVLTVMDMGMPAGAMEGAQQQQQQPQAQQNNDSGGGLSGLAARGILGGFGRKKKANADQPDSANASPVPPGTLMQTTTESSGFSPAPVDTSKFEVPAGFQQVQAEEGGRK